MDFLTFILIIIIIGGILGIVYIISYNKLQFLKSKIEQAENLADEALRNKFDNIVKANTIIKKVLKNKKDYLKDYISLKDKKVTNFDLDRELVEAISTIDSLISDYEKLQSNHELQDIIYEIKNIDEKLTAAKNYYNKNTTESNRIIRTFPCVIVAKIHRFKIKAYFDGKNMQDEIIDDFKL